MFRNKVVVITGGARGIGEAISLRLAAEGAKIAIVDILLDVAEETAKKFAELGYEAKAYAANVAKVEDADATVKQVIADFGRVDILVNNAGVTKDGLLMRMSDADWDFVIDTNLKGTFLFSRAVTRPMMKNKAADGSAQGGYSTVTLEVTPREAEMLAFAEQIRGRLSLSLRNRSDVSYEKELPKVDFEKIRSTIEELNLKRQQKYVK